MKNNIMLLIIVLLVILIISMYRQRPREMFRGGKKCKNPKLANGGTCVNGCDCTSGNCYRENPSDWTKKGSCMDPMPKA